MKFLPTENLSYVSQLKEEEIIQRLHNCIEPRKFLRFARYRGGSKKHYEGEINGQHFDIKRIISYQNSFLPRIRGVILSNENGSTIDVKMSLPMIVLILLCVWFVAAVLVCIAVLSKVLSGSDFYPAAFIPFAIFLFIYAITLGAFKFESHKSKKDFLILFEAKLSEP